MSFSQEVMDLMKEARAGLDRGFYDKFVGGQLSERGLKEYYKRLYHECSYFVRLISLIHSMAEDRYTRELVAQNLMEEYGQGNIEANHPYLAMRVGCSLGCSEDEIEAAGPTPELRAYYDVLFDLARSSYIEGLAALCFHESDLPTRLAKMKHALIDHYGVAAKDLRYYDEHIEEGSSIVDPNHPGYGGDDVHVMRQVDAIERYAASDEERNRVREAIRRAAEARDRLNRAFDDLCGFVN